MFGDKNNFCPPPKKKKRQLRPCPVVPLCPSIGTRWQPPNPGWWSPIINIYEPHITTLTITLLVSHAWSCPRPVRTARSATPIPLRGQPDIELHLLCFYASPTQSRSSSPSFFAQFSNHFIFLSFFMKFYLPQFTISPIKITISRVFKSPTYVFFEVYLGDKTLTISAIVMFDLQW